MEGDIVTTQELFTYRQEGYDENHKSIGKFVSTGIRPKCCEKIITSGVQIDDHWFF
jgi:pilus assembly protein CpaF